MMERVVVEAVECNSRSYEDGKWKPRKDVEAFEQAIVNGHIVDLPLNYSLAESYVSAREIGDVEDRDLADEYVSVTDQIVADEKYAFSADAERTYHPRAFDNLTWRDYNYATQLGIAKFRKNGVTVTCINGIVDRTVSVWTYHVGDATHGGDVIAKCVGRKGCGCQVKSSYRSWLQHAHGIAMDTLRPFVADEHILMREWLALLADHENVCRGRNGDRQRNIEYNALDEKRVALNA